MAYPKVLSALLYPDPVSLGAPRAEKIVLAAVAFADVHIYLLAVGPKRSSSAV